MKIIEKEFNLQTGEETITERDATSEELAKRAEFEAAYALVQSEAEAKATLRQEILDRLNLTAEEAQLVLKGN